MLDAALEGQGGAVDDGVVEGGTRDDHDRQVLRANTLITWGLTDFLLSGVEAAMARFAAAGEVIDALGDDGLLARLEYQRANVYGRAGDLTAAWAGLDGALRSLDAFTPKEQCSVRISRGMLAFEMALPSEALESFVEAGRLAHELELPPQEFMAKHNEGYAAFLLGELPRALDAMASADEIEADVSRAEARLDRAKVLLEAGLLSEAVEALQRAIERLDGSGTDQIRAECGLELARGLRLIGQLDAAASAADEAQATFARIGAVAWESKAVLIGLRVDLDRLRERRRRRAKDAVRGGDDSAVGAATSAVAGALTSPDEVIERGLVEEADSAVAAEAAAAADRLVATAIELGDADLADAARVVAAESFILAGDIDGAVQRVSERGSTTPASLSAELNAAAVTASVLVASGEPDRARRVVTRAARRLAAGQEGSASLDLRTAQAVHGARLGALELDLAVPRGAGAVLQALDRWRSATDRLPSLGRPDDERLAVLTENLRSVRGQLRGLSDPEQARELERRAVGLMRQIRSRDWALSSEGAQAAPTPVRIREARAVLDTAERDLVWLFAHSGRLCGVGVIGGRARVRDLMPLAHAVELAHRMRVDLRAASTRALGPLTHAVWGSLMSSAVTLDDAVIRPWASRRGGLVLVTCAEVSALPWALLPSLRGRPLTVARSLTAFARREAAPTGGVPPVHVSVGPGVARATAEAEAITAAWGGKVAVSRPSRAKVLVEALSGPGVVHVAAHGTHQIESPLFSSLVLHDGPVFAHELQPTGVGADHIVLSACDVGLASLRPGDEALGLAASMLSLGARSAVAAVSPVPDDVAAAAMSRHHEGLAAGRSSDVALADAIAASEPVAAAFLNLGGRYRP